jgi:hypothetical protein
MHRLPLILCAVALLGSVVSAGLYFEVGNTKHLLELRLADATARTTRLESDIATAREQNGALRAKVGALDARLDVATTKLSAAETRAAQLDRDLADTRSVLSVYEMTARALAGEVAALRTDLEEARHSAASPDAVAAYRNTIAELERQLAMARDGAAAPSAAGASTAVFTNRAGRASVLTVGPESAFVVLNFGAVRGAQVGQRLTVSQGQAVVATVLISDVRTNFSIAHVLPETLRGVLHKGDSAVLVR